MHNQTFLNDYFKNHWQPRTSDNMYSSYQTIAKKINPDHWVLDVGCGNNDLRDLLPNVIGIDPANDRADYMVTIEEFQPLRLFDVAVCLGSINFGDRSVIQQQIECMVRCLKPSARVFWRLNPGRQDHRSPDCKRIQFYPWTHAELSVFAQQHGFRQINDQVEINGDQLRLYCEWQR